MKELCGAGVQARGAIFTRREVVDFVLDLVGYTTDQPLQDMRLLEPAFGQGDFLLPAAQRLLDAYRAHRPARQRDPVSDLDGALRGIELHGVSFNGTRGRLMALLGKAGFSDSQCRALADAWLRQGDFLLADLPGPFTHVVGNPPYVRQELIPDALMTEYRRRFKTIFDRADLYIPFIEKSLACLIEGGHLGFICADRWMKNRYGGPLRRMVAEGFHLKAYVDMVDTQAFHTEVIAYPAITVIVREKSGPTRIAHRPAIDARTLSDLAARLLSRKPPEGSSPVKEIVAVIRDSEPWILESSDQLALVRRLEDRFPTIEQAGCTVGIGVATGADAEFIGPHDKLDVEEDRKLPLVMTRDIANGRVDWGGVGCINPFRDDGKLVDLRDYPRLAHYLESRKARLVSRYVARKNPANWYRTIDRIDPALVSKPKLLIPDIKGDALVVHEEGRLYPHHNLYFITSDRWDLKALQAVLLSGIARLFVSIYSTKMQGGYLRFQAQYLRRIRLPRWEEVPQPVRNALTIAAEQGDVTACNQAVFRLYDLSWPERAALGGNEE
ncbi:MAG TPA: Eco57I restriction-modification methylase domain-containing protein [Candidatus Competibacter sp.]|nr:Eco57I restriction-modification methylase domain-containing protein [Candidatus Competibacter sp.]